MVRLNLKNNAETTLTQAVNTSDTTFIVEDASALPDAPYRLSIGDEIVEVTSVSGDELTVERAKEGSVAGDYDVGETLENRFTTGVYDGLADKAEVDAVSDELTTHLAEYTQQLGTATLETTDKTLKGAINEVFTTGNNVKRDMVDALLSVDDSLPIDYESTWQEIEVVAGRISTGLSANPGNIIIYTHDNVTAPPNTTYTKVIEIKSNFSGSVRTGFSFAINQNTDGFIRIYINGEPVGIERTIPNVVYSEDLSVNKGDFIQLYAKRSERGGEFLAPVVREFTLSVNEYFVDAITL